MRYIIDQRCSLDGNKLMFEKVHLLDCTKDGVNLIEELIEARNTHKATSAEDIVRALDGNYSISYIQSLL